MCNMKGVAHSDYYTQTFISDISKHFSIFQQIVLVFKAWNLTVCYLFLSPLSLHCFQQWKQAALPAQQQAVDRQCYSMSKQQGCQTCFSLKRLTQRFARSHLNLCCFLPRAGSRFSRVSWAYMLPVAL